MSSEQPPGTPAGDDGPAQPRPRPVAPPGQVSTPDQLPTVEPGEWPAQPTRPMVVEPPAPPALSPPPPPPPQIAPPPPYVPGPVVPARRSLAWLWVGLAAAVVLVVGVAATLVVAGPWQGLESDRDLAAETRETEQPDVEPGDADATEPPPTAAPPSTSPAPAPESPVTADLDGDGHGDAVAVIGAGDDVRRIVLSSTGRSFKLGSEVRPTYEDRTWADFDGDGALDEVSWSYELGGTLTLTSEDMDFRQVDLGLRLDVGQPFVTLKSGDADGDGLVDLVAYGATGPRQVSVWVIRNNGRGFEQPEEWARLPNTTYALTAVLPADFTGDGATDLAVRVPVGRLPRRAGDVELGFLLLTSRSTSFSEGPLRRQSALVDRAEVVVGDFFRAGTPLVLLIGESRDGLTVQALRASGDSLRLDPRWEANIGSNGAVIDAVVSDVDGDRADDVVFTTFGRTGREYDGFRVLRSTGSGLERSGVWAPTPRCPGRRCSFYFQNSY